MGGYWIVLAGCGWLLDPFGWLWVVTGSFWLVVGGFGWFRVAAGGCVFYN